MLIKMVVDLYAFQNHIFFIKNISRGSIKWVIKKTGSKYLRKINMSSLCAIISKSIQKQEISFCLIVEHSIVIPAQWLRHWEFVLTFVCFHLRRLHHVQLKWENWHSRIEEQPPITQEMDSEHFPCYLQRKYKIPKLYKRR